MNFKRGLFRIWLLLSIGFVVIASALAWPGLRSEFEDQAKDPFSRFSGSLLVPIDCAKARGSRDDYQPEEKPWQLDWATRPPVGTQVCWYELATYRNLYPEDAGLSDRAVSNKLYRAMGIRIIDPPSPWWSVAKAVALILGIPLLTLAVGQAVIWAIAGFKVSPIG